MPDLAGTDIPPPHFITKRPPFMFCRRDTLDGCEKTCCHLQNYPIEGVPGFRLLQGGKNPLQVKEGLEVASNAIHPKRREILRSF